MIQKFCSHRASSIQPPYQLKSKKSTPFPPYSFPPPWPRRSPFHSLFSLAISSISTTPLNILTTDSFLSVWSIPISLFPSHSAVTISLPQSVESAIIFPSSSTLVNFLFLFPPVSIALPWFLMILLALFPIASIAIHAQSLSVAVITLAQSISASKVALVRALSVSKVAPVRALYLVIISPALSPSFLATIPLISIRSSASPFISWSSQFQLDTFSLSWFIWEQPTMFVEIWKEYQIFLPQTLLDS